MSALPTDFNSITQRLLEPLRKQDADDSPGSIVRSLIETFAREVAVFYGMLDGAYRAGFLDTAEGEALDQVVAILGIRRARAGRLTGAVEFGRASPASSDIAIPAGWQVTGTDAQGTPLPMFETVEDAVLPRGELRVVVSVQQAQRPASAKPPASLNPNSLTIMTRPVLGIETVANPSPILCSSQDETDASLRARARTALRDGSKGTLSSIEAAVRETGIKQVTASEPASGPPGVVEVIITDPNLSEEHKARVRDAVRRSKAAGIRCNLSFARTVYIQPVLTVEPADSQLSDREFERLRAELIQLLRDYLASLGPGVLIRRRKLEGVLYGHAGVHGVSELALRFYHLPDSRVPIEDPTLRTQGGEGDWTLQERETPVLAPELLPVNIQRFAPATYVLDLVVTKVDGRSRDDVRRDLTRALDGLPVALAVAFSSAAPCLTFENLRGQLMSRAGLTDVTSAVLTYGAVATVLGAVDGSQGAVRASLILAKGWRLVLGIVNVVEGNV